MKSSKLVRKTYLFATVIITIPMILFGWMNAINTRERIMAEKERMLMTIAGTLEQRFPNSYEAILLQYPQAVSEHDKRMAIHQSLQPIVNELAERYPEYGLGYGTNTQRVAFYPFRPEIFTKPISEKARSVYDTKESVLSSNLYSPSWGAPAMVLFYPLFYSGEVIGHVWVNTKLTGVQQAIHFAWAQNLVILIISWLGLIFLLQRAFTSIGKEVEAFSACIVEKKDDLRQLSSLPELKPLRKAVMDLRDGLRQEKDVVADALAAVQQVLDRISDLFFALDRDFRFIYTNKRMTELYKQVAIGDCIWDVLPSIRPFAPQFNQALAEQISISYTTYAVTIQKWVEVTLYPSQHGLTVYLKDIHAQKLAQGQLKEQARLIDLVQDPLIMWDMSGTIILWNGGAEKTYGWSKEEALGKNITDLVQSKFPQPLVDIMDELLSHHYWEGELIDTCKDGRQMVVWSSWSVNRGENGEPLSVFVLNHDITEKRKLEEEIARFDRLNVIGEMAAGIGHEVRNPLTTVRGYLQMFSHKLKFVEYQEQFKTMIEELDRANSIISEFLSLAKDRPLSMEASNLNDIIQPLFPLLQADGFRMGHQIQLELGSIPECLLDPNEIRQLILNLVRNAFEAMKIPGRVRITTAYEQGEIILAVKDKGCGIPQEILAKLGTPFVTTKDTGTGLGLPVCYRVAQRHNAQIDIETSSAGTVFFIKFPAVGSGDS